MIPRPPRASDRVQVQLLGADLQVRRLRPAVEVEREVVRREDLAEHHRGGQGRHRGDVPVVHAVAPQRVVDEPAERVVAGAGDHRRAPPVPRGRDGHVGRAAAEPFAEGLDVLEPHAHLQRVQVRADPAHREDLERAHLMASLAGASLGRAGGARNDTVGGRSSPPGHRSRWVVPEARRPVPWPGGCGSRGQPGIDRGCLM